MAYVGANEPFGKTQIYLPQFYWMRSMYDGF